MIGCGKRQTGGQIYGSPELMACRKRIQSHGEAKAQDSPFVGVMVGVDSFSPFSVCRSGPSPWIKVEKSTETDFAGEVSCANRTRLAFA